MTPEVDPLSPRARRDRRVLLIATAILVMLPLVLGALSLVELF